MAKNRQPILKRCKTLGISPAVMGVYKDTNRNPKKDVRKKQSEYGLQLTEKQKVKFVYGVLEKQFLGYYKKAAKANGLTGDILLQLLERRLDNVIYRLGWAKTRREARQLVNHGHFLIDGKRVDIPSYSVKIGEVITVKEKSRQSVKFAELLETNAGKIVPAWLDRNAEAWSGTVVKLPERTDIDFDVNERLIIELYSK